MDTAARWHTPYEQSCSKAHCVKASVNQPDNRQCIAHLFMHRLMFRPAPDLFHAMHHLLSPSELILPAENRRSFLSNLLKAQFRNVLTPESHLQKSSSTGWRCSSLPSPATRCLPAVSGCFSFPLLFQLASSCEQAFACPMPRAARITAVCFQEQLRVPSP